MHSQCMDGVSYAVTGSLAATRKYELPYTVAVATSYTGTETPQVVSTTVANL